MAAGGPETQYTLHWLVWHNDYEAIEQQFTTDVTEPVAQPNLELLDPHGRTPLHLAVTLGHLESARVLLRHGANANAENAAYWTVLQEAVCTGDPELVQVVLKYRDFQRYTKRTVGVPELLQKLRESVDFYMEMKWEFTSWVPLVARMCPSDVYRIWKSGSSVRIDTTLLGFDNMSWQRGKRSYIFTGSGEMATMMEIDHDAQEVYSETMRTASSPLDASVMEPSEEVVAARLTAPAVTTYIDTDRIAFERNRSGVWGWRSDKTESINNYECKVFSASTVELVTKTRQEHMTEQDKSKNKKISRTPLESFLGMAEEHNKKQGQSNGDIISVSYNPSSVTPEEYFSNDINMKDRDIGRPKEETTKTQKFKATMWLSEDHPLSLQEQVLPIIDLMAASNAHFKKLRDFITLQLPSGFPVKIEIPLFHIINARITFGNIFAIEKSVDGVQALPDDRECCVIDDSCFIPPPEYHRIGDMPHGRLHDEDDELLQFAIQQSLVEVGTEDEQVTFWEALNKATPRSNADGQSGNDSIMQRAIAESINYGHPDGTPTMGGILNSGLQSSNDEQFRLALEMSLQDQSDSTQQQQEEDEELQRILLLSLTDK